MADNACWSFCPSCGDFILISHKMGYSKAYSMGPKAKHLVAALCAEQAQRPETKERIGRIISGIADEIRQNGPIGEPAKELSKPAQAKRTPRKKRS